MHQQEELIGHCRSDAATFDQKKTDFYADAKDSIRSKRIDSLSLVSFCHLSALGSSGAALHPIDIYHLLARSIYHIVFSPVCRRAGISSLEVRHRCRRKKPLR